MKSRERFIDSLQPARCSRFRSRHYNFSNVMTNEARYNVHRSKRSSLPDVRELEPLAPFSESRCNRITLRSPLEYGEIGDLPEAFPRTTLPSTGTITRSEMPARTAAQIARAPQLRHPPRWNESRRKLRKRFVMEICLDVGESLKDREN